MTNDTKGKIADTFIELLKSKPYSKISIKDICEATPTSRYAFYYYFENKEALVQWIVIEQFIKYSVPYFAIFAENTATKSFFNYIYKRSEFYKAIYRYDQGMLLKKCLMEAYKSALEPELRKEFGKDVIKDKYRIDPRIYHSYANAGIAEVVVFWIGDGMKIPIEKVAKDLALMLNRSLEDVRDYYL